MIANIKKEDYDAVASNNWPSYDDYVSGVQVSQDVQFEIDRLVKNTHSIYDEEYDYLSLEPFFIKKNNLTEKQYKKLVQSKNFCMLPWVHLHAFPDGRAYPCCMSDYWHPVGDLRKNTMEEVWNQQPYRTLRNNMINDQPSKECKRCYEQEANGFFSLRNDSNRNYGHYIGEVDNTNADGYHPEFKIRYWDVRFSNLCNFSCRSCGPIFSSNWFNDHVKLHDRKPDVLGREMLRVEYTAGNEDSMIEQMLPHIPYLEQVYFAGGEPLIMKEHYFLLEKLIELGKTDIRIQYNTNFSELRYKDKHIFEYWKHFKNVSVGASLDASGARAELMRKGTDWQQTVKNRRRMIEEVPHVDFYVSATVSAMNILHVLDFHKEWTDLELIKAKDFNVNLCQSPSWYRPNIFPQWFKEQVIIPKYIKHLEWLTPMDTLQRATNGYKSLLNFISTANAEVEIHEFEYETFKGDSWPSWENFLKGERTNNTNINNEIEQFVKSIKQVNEFKEFKNQIEKLDNIRNENFWKTFPELNDLA